MVHWGGGPEPGPGSCGHNSAHFLSLSYLNAREQGDAIIGIPLKSSSLSLASLMSFDHDDFLSLAP